MQRTLQNFDSSRLLRLFIIASVCLGAAGFGILVTGLRFQLRELVILVLGMIALGLVLVPTERVLRFGFWLWIFSFGLGWRTINVIGALSVHPSEILVWLLFMVLGIRSTLKKSALDWKIPITVLLFLFMGLLGSVNARFNNVAWEDALLEFKVMLAIVPSFYVVKWLVHTRQDWEFAGALTIPLGVYLACLGLLDVFLPGLSRTLGALPEGTVIELGTSQGFSRALFLIFGAPLAAAVILTFLGFTIHGLMKRNLPLLLRLVMVAALFIQLWGIYLSGYRVIYFATIILFVVYAGQVRRGWLLILGGLVIVPFLPTAFYERFLSLVDVRYADSSQVKRIDMAVGAFDLIQRSPLIGGGWGASGYPHSDLLQITANLGIPAVLFFLGWIGSLLWQVWFLARRVGWFREYAAVFFASICAILVMLAGEGLSPFIQLMIPVWFLLAMAHRLIDLAQES